MMPTAARSHSRSAPARECDRKSYRAYWPERNGSRGSAGILPASGRGGLREAATCLAVQCFNAAGTVSRLCVDLATRGVLPPADAEGGPNAKQRRDLGLRLPWLFDHGKLSDGLRGLSHSIKEDGNDGAHAGTLNKEDAEDLLEFAMALLERVYTEPERLKLARERREQRRTRQAK